MSHNDTNIEELFRSGLEDFEVPVNDTLWSSISTQVAQPTVASASGLSTLMKTMIVTGGITAVTGAAMLVSLINTDYVHTIAPSVILTTPSNIETPTNSSQQTNSEYQNIVANIAEDKKPVDDALITSSVITDKKSVVKVTSTEESGYKSVAQLFMSPPKKGFSSTPSHSVATTSSNPGNPSVITETAKPTTSVSIEEVKPNQLIANIIAMPVGGYAPLEVAFATQVNPDVHVLWNFGDGTTAKEAKPTHIFEKFGNYTVTLTLTDAKGKTYTDSRTIEVLASSAITNIPTVFTPNNDGQNDYFYITGKNIATFQLMVTDVKGNTVYTSTDLDEKWDGKNQYGKLIPAGNYALILMARGTDGRVFEHTGVLYVKY
jgi:gliding motility-associated-like protein